MPVAPVAPVAPVGPVSPVAPFMPGLPVAPVAPVSPVAPVAPVSPVAPVAPVSPVAPVAAVPAGKLTVEVPGNGTPAGQTVTKPAWVGETTVTMTAIARAEFGMPQVVGGPVIWKARVVDDVMMPPEPIRVSAMRHGGLFS